MTPAPAGFYFVEKLYGKGIWAIVSRGTLAECYAWIQAANRGRRRKEQYRVLDPAGRVVPMGAEGK